MADTMHQPTKTHYFLPDGRKVPRVSTVDNPRGLPDLPHIVEAAQIGTTAHSLIANAVDPHNHDIPDVEARLAGPVSNAFSAWKKWRDSVGDFWPVLVERTHLSEELFVGGTMDLVADFGHGYEVVDWKTGQPRKSDKVKTAGAYSLLASEHLEVPVNRARVVYCGKKDGEFKEVIIEDLAEWREVFLRKLVRYHCTIGREQ